MADPLGISTGQGQGEAQVFGNTYNDYYAKKADEGAAKKAEIEQGLASISGGVWDRDLGIFKPQLNDVRKYVEDNARAIIDGDFDANIGWNKKKNELTQFINSSKAAKKFYETNLALYNKNPEKYSKLSKSDLLSYANTPGEFGSNIYLEPNFDPQKSLDAMRTAIKSVEYRPTGTVVKDYGTDQEFLVETTAQRKEAAKEILDAQIARDIKMYGREAAAHWTQDNIDNELAALEKSLGSTSKSKQITQPNQFTFDREGRKQNLAEQLKRDVWLAQNYVGEESDLALQKLAEADKNILSVRHTASDPVLEKKYPGAGGLVINRRRGNDVIEEFVDASDYNTLLKNMLRSGLYPSNIRDYLEVVPGYTPTPEQAELAGQRPEKAGFTQDVNDYSLLLSDMFKRGDKDKFQDYAQSLGISDDLSGRLQASVGQKKGMTTEDVVNFITPDLKGKSQAIEVKSRFGKDDSFGGDFESISYSDDEVTIAFKAGDETTEVTFDTSDPRQKEDFKSLIKEMLGGTSDSSDKNVSSPSGKKPLPKLTFN